LAVLEALSRVGGPHRLGDIATGSGVGKPSAHRILQDLVASGFAAAPTPGAYSPGPRLLALASMVLGDEATASTVASVLHRLGAATGFTVHLAVRSDVGAVYIHKINSDQPYEMASRVGMRVPLYCTAVGKCMLAWLDRTEIDDLWNRTTPTARTANTITTRRKLGRELAVIREQGYAVDDEENERNVRCIGAPVWDAQRTRVIGGVSVSALVFQLTRTDADDLAPAVVATATELAGVLPGGSGRARPPA
jgi:IclR family transcriptional regulator, acetate operon repressor